MSGTQPVDKVSSVNGVQIRLTVERWKHIVESHNDLAGSYHDVLEAVAEPDCIYKGNFDELIAIREKLPGKFLAVLYREVSNSDGFIITAFFTRRINTFQRREITWQKPK